jgi:hypothetical protein
MKIQVVYFRDLTSCNDVIEGRVLTIFLSGINECGDQRGKEYT